MKIGLEQTVVLGPPGTGKTTDAIRRVEAALEQGIQPEEIAFVSFTRKAVGEAVERACKRFGFKPRRFPLFQTVHSLCFHQLGCTKGNLMSRQNFIELGEWLGYDLTGQVDMGDGIISSGAAPGDKFLFLDNIARVKCQSVRQTWEDEGFDIDWSEQERFSKGYLRYKERTGLMDFTDLLHEYIKGGRATNPRLAIIDEAQDLSRAQWAVLQKCFAATPQTIIAGDDDQSIYKWSGADLDTFLSLAGDKIVLSQSHRLPRPVYLKAVDVIKQVEKRYTKEFAPTENTGQVDYINALEHMNIKDDESTLILVRNVYLLNEVYDVLKKQGLTYTGRGGFASVKPAHVGAIIAWERMRRGDTISIAAAKEMYSFLRVDTIIKRGSKTKLNELEDSGEDLSYEILRDHYGLINKPVWHEALQGIPLESREYYVSVLRSERKISKEPLVHVNTIHGVKGGEADHVIILSDMSKRTYMEMQKDRDSELRVAYVALTRAKKRLTIVLPRSKYSFPY